MKTFTLADLIRHMRSAAGEDESINLAGDIADKTFADLGYDSLAVMETTSQIEQEIGVSLPEETMSAADTPKQYIALVNKLLPNSA
jgi:act minimal PKS acyl carrier protein